MEGGKDARLQSSHAESDFHYQLWLFLFHFTTAINHRVTGSQGWRGWRAERRKNGQFSSKKELSIKTSEMEPRLCQRPVEAMRTDGDLFGFNRKRASGER